MTKAKKGLIITLFAAMMVFAFGATSVFGTTGNTDNVKWASDCSSVDITSDGVTTTWNKIAKAQDSDGLWHVWVDPTQYSQSIQVPNAEAYYWDLKDAKLGYAVKTEGQFHPVYVPYAFPTDFTRGDYEETASDGIYASASVKLEAGGYSEYNPMGGGTWDESTARVWYGVIKGYDAYDPDNTGAQTVLLSYGEKYYNQGVHQGTYHNPFVLNANISKEVNIAAYVPTASDVELYFDSVEGKKLNKDSEAFRVPYDGSTHKIVANDVEGFKVSYKVYESGAWKDADDVSVTNVDEDVVFQVVVKDSKGKDVTKDAGLDGTKTAKVMPVKKWKWGFGFVTTDGDAASGYVSEYNLPGSEYNPADYFAVAARSGEKCVSAAAAIEANKAELMNFFNDCFVIDASEQKFVENTVKLQIKAKEDLDLKAMSKKYEALGKNFGFVWTSATALLGSIDSSTSNDNVVPEATLNLNVASLDDEVLFTEAPDMTYHVKKAKKLKKTKSFTVAAATASGKVVSYKMDSSSKKITIDSATGKITVKKGIKKGTYKVKVIASTTDGDGYKAAFAVRYLQIKVKK